jgi:hypothetical protein
MADPQRIGNCGLVAGLALVLTCLAAEVGQVLSPGGDIEVTPSPPRSDAIQEFAWLSVTHELVYGVRVCHQSSTLTPQE